MLKLNGGNRQKMFNVLKAYHTQRDNGLSQREALTRVFSKIPKEAIIDAEIKYMGDYFMRFDGITEEDAIRFTIFVASSRQLPVYYLYNPYTLERANVVSVDSLKTIGKLGGLETATTKKSKTTKTAK